MLESLDIVCSILQKFKFSITIKIKNTIPFKKMLLLLTIFIKCVDISNYGIDSETLKDVF